MANDKPKKQKTPTVKNTIGIHFENEAEWHLGIAEDCKRIKVKEGRSVTIHERLQDVVVAGCKALGIKPKKY
jgi:hypothetical protein